MQRNPSRTTTSKPVVHVSPSARRPVEQPVIDMDQIWATQTVENAKWIELYGSLIQGAMLGALMTKPKEGESDDITLDYEALAMEADHAYSRYAARLRGQRGKQ